jgi:predicted site-specific integrase-resolvase
VAISTLREWDNEGKLTPVKTFGNHRRYLVTDVLRLQGTLVEDHTKTGITVATYARVSSHEQKTKGDLGRQHDRLQVHCAAKGYTVAASYQEVGSGMSDTRPKLLQLFKLVQSGEITKVIIEYKDRLARFNLRFLIEFFASHNVEIECVEEVLGKSYEQELVADMLSLISSFSSKIYGKRSAGRKRNKKNVDTTGIQDGATAEQSASNIATETRRSSASSVQLGTTAEEISSPEQGTHSECHRTTSPPESVEEDGHAVALRNEQSGTTGSSPQSGSSIRQLLEEQERSTKRQTGRVPQTKEQEEWIGIIPSDRQHPRIRERDPVTTSRQDQVEGERVSAASG